MISSELRIGNWVAVGLNQSTVTAVTWNSVQLMGNLITNRISQVSPIPLTPEILEQCGFKYEHDQLGMTFRCGKLVMFYDGEGFGRNFGMDAHDDRMDVNVQHLHQLQNLYFALTNEELILNLSLSKPDIQQ